MDTQRRGLTRKDLLKSGAAAVPARATFITGYGCARWNPPDGGANQDIKQAGGGRVDHDHRYFNVDEETMRAPLIFSNPRRYPKPVKSDALVSHVDFLPTLATLFDAPRSARADWQGVDYQSGQANLPYPALPNHIVSIRERRWKLARYDLKTDPLERIDLAYEGYVRSPEQERRRLKRKLRRVERDRLGAR